MRAGVKERSLCPSLRTRAHVLIGTKIDLHRRPFFIFHSAATHSFDPVHDPAIRCHSDCN